MALGHLFSFGLKNAIRKLTFLKKRYPVLIRQNRLLAPGPLFEASNEIEEWRIRSLDDEESFLRLILAELKHDDIFFDIGACVGIYAIHAAAHCRHVFAFEPDPGFRHRLSRNCHLNGTSNITIMPFAVSIASGPTALYTGGVAGRSPSLCDLGQGPPLQVETLAIDDALYRGQLPHPTVIKMDIEGAEFLALKGMQSLLRSTLAPRTLFIEIHPIFLKNLGGTAEEVSELITSAGYSLTRGYPRDQQYHALFTKAPCPAC